MTWSFPDARRIGLGILLVALSGSTLAGGDRQGDSDGALSPLDSSEASGLGHEGGDQMLDGIGETALIARYMLQGDLRDASRNGFDLHWERSDAPRDELFLDDSHFGRVLSLSAPEGQGALRIPAEALAAVDALTVTGWWHVQPDSGSGALFDFRAGDTHRLTAVLGREPNDYEVALIAGGQEFRLAAEQVRVPRGSWVHLAVVLDPGQHGLGLYVNGRRVDSAQADGGALARWFDAASAPTSPLDLYLGGAPGAGRLDAALHDVRLYNTGLPPTGIARIHGRHAAGGVEGDVGGELEGMADGAGRVWQGAWAAGLEEVPDVRIETWQGHLPHLPYFLPGRYRGRDDQPPVRVLWPAPTDNRPVRRTGSYVVWGKVPGTDLRPRASITVRGHDEPLAPPRTGDGQELSDFGGSVVAARPRPDAGPEQVLEPFPLSEVALERDERGRTTPFQENRDKFVQGLLASAPDRFLYMFRDAFGQPQPEGAQPLGLWDSQTTRLRGHATGHYLTALAQAYAGATDDPAAQKELRRKIAYCVETLHQLANQSGRPAEDGGPFVADPRAVPPGPGRDGYDSNLSQEGIRTDYWNWGEGFLSAYPPDQFIMLEHGATYGGSDHQIWAPYYTLDKILKGLLDCYELAGEEKALDTARGMARWVALRLEPLPDSTRFEMWNRYIAGEYGGMNAVMARLHALTGEERFLHAARRFDNVAFFFGDAERPHGLARNVDTIRGRHANQHVPQILGALRFYARTGEPDYYRIAENFWNLSYHSYTYCIGGVAGARVPNNAECYTAEPDRLFAQGFSEGGQNETCATYNLLRLTRELFLFHPHGRYMDYYEQALVNHILASVAPDDPGNTYHVPLNPGARKHFGNACMTGFTCCNGTALDSHTKLQNSIYFRCRQHTAVYVNLFIPSTLNWSERQIVLRQQTRYPYGQSTRLSIEGAGEFALQLRIPGWATGEVEVTINGEPQPVTARPGHYLALERNWSDGDTVELHLPFPFHWNRVMDRPDLASLFYGPVLLAVEEAEPLSEWRRIARDERDIPDAVQGDPDALRFELDGLNLKPFFEFGSERHSVYLKIGPE